MASLYEITREEEMLLSAELMDGRYLTDEGEILEPAEYEKRMAETFENEKAKRIAIFKYMKNQQADLDALNTEAERLTKKAKSIEKNLEYYRKEYLPLCFGNKSVKTEIGTFAVHKSKVCNVLVAPEKLPDKYKKVKVEIKLTDEEIAKLAKILEIAEADVKVSADVAGLKKAIAEGAELSEYATLVENVSFSLR